MKKIFCFLFLIVLASCSQDNLDVESSNILSESPIQKGAGDGRFDVLGYGCDIAYDYYTGKGQVIDSDLLYRADTSYIHIDKSAYDDEYTESGITAEHYLKTVSKQKGINLGGSTSDSVAAGKISLSKTFRDSTSYSVTNSFVSMVKFKHVRSNSYAMAPKDLVKFASAAFKNAINNNYTPQEMIRIFGTHVYTNVKLGGKLAITYRGEINKSNSDRIKAVTTNASFIYGKFFSVSTSSSNYEHEQAQKEVENYSCHIQTWGGKDGIDKPAEYNSIPTFNYKAWHTSVDANDGTSLKMYDFAPNTLIPLWEFVEAGAKREELKAAIIKYVKENELKNSKQPKVEAVPLYQFSKNGQYHYNTNIYSSGWTNQGITCYVYNTQINGSVPLYQFSKNGEYHYSTNVSSSGWTNQGITCYVYNIKNNGSVPLYQFSKNGQYHYGTNNYSSGWTNQGITCYVLTQK